MTPNPSANDTRRFSATTIPHASGIGLRGPHMVELERTRADIAWLEVHAENYFGDGGAPIHYLEKIREHYPISLHGVGLSLGSSDPLNREHLACLRDLNNWLEPGLVSEHLSWSSIDRVYFNDLLPLPYTEEALSHFSERVLQVQDYLRRNILVENPASYLKYRHSVIPEAEFISEICRRTGAGILLDVNNLYVSSFNLGFDPLHYLALIPAEYVMEIHLAGHSEKKFAEGSLLIDDHASRVAAEVWGLYADSLDVFGNRPSLVEWDAQLPSLAQLLDEATTAQNYLDRSHAGTE